MAVMTHRTTFALDADTAARIKRLAECWRVSQAEVVRRAVASAEEQLRPDPAARLRDLHATGQGLDLLKADAYLAQVHRDREHWRGQ